MTEKYSQSRLYDDRMPLPFPLKKNDSITILKKINDSATFLKWQNPNTSFK